MNVLLMGSTQVKHISNLYQLAGHKVRIFENKYGKLSSLMNLLWCDMIYVVSGCDVSRYTMFRAAAFLNKKIIIHWIGTDVLIATEKYKETGDRINQGCIHVCGSSLLKKELHDIGIESEVIPIVPTDIHFEPIEPAKEHAVLAYIPLGREDFYNYPLLKEVALAFPTLQFYIVANDGSNETDRIPNIHFLGKISPDGMKKVYQKTSILFRYPKHDGLSMMVLEALGLGRSVVYKYEFPYAITPKSEALSDIIDAFNSILETPPYANEDSVNYINENFSLEKQIQQYKSKGII